MNFLFQTIDGKIKHDFSFTLIESCEFNNWYYKNKEMQCFFSEIPEKLEADKLYIPIGNVEFVIEYLKKYYNSEPKPINIPNELMNFEWTGRHIFNGTEKDIIGLKFVKSNEKIKHFTKVCDRAPEGNYQISDLIDIKSEWRAFVYKSELVGLQNYSGEFDIFPDVNKIRQMINAYKLQPIAFTLDIAITKKKETVVIEVHDFFSCGLYGFSEHKILPHMFSKWFYSFVKK